MGDDPRPTLTAFVGGLDLTDGRYDTPDHPLFSSLNTMHKAQKRKKSAKEKKRRHLLYLRYCQTIFAETIQFKNEYHIHILTRVFPCIGRFLPEQCTGHHSNAGTEATLAGRIS